MDCSLRAGGEVTINTGEGPGLDLVSCTVTAETGVGLAGSGLPPGECSGGKRNELLSFRNHVSGGIFSEGEGVVTQVSSILNGIIAGILSVINGAIGNIIPVLILEGILDLGLGVSILISLVNGLIDGFDNGGGEAKAISVVVGARDG